VDSINGLNENDFNARWLDNAVPGFKSSDPLAERHPDESPYLYCGNNPVNRVDPTGLQWYTKEGGSKTDFFFFKDKSINPYISGGVRYNLAGETVSAYVGDDGKFTYFKKGDKFGNVTDEKCVNVASTTVTGINLSLASGGGNYNNTAPDRSSGNNGNSNSGQKSETSFINKTVNYYEISKPVIDITTTVLTSKFPQLKGLGPITTGLDFVKDSYLFFDSEVITGKRYSYRAVGAGLALFDVPLAGPSFAVGEIMFDKLCSITSWINNAFTTQNILDSDYFPH